MLRSPEQFFHYQVDDKTAVAPLVDVPAQEVKSILTRKLPLQPDLDVQAKSELHEIPADAFLVFSIAGNYLELRHSGNQSELLYVFGDEEHSYYYLLRYLLTREGEFSQSELKGVIKEIERTADFHRNKLTGILERLQNIIDSHPTLKKIMQLHVRTEKRKLFVRVETAVRPELLYQIRFDEVYVFGTPEIINSGQPGARIDKQEKAQALTAALNLLHQAKTLPDQYPQFQEGWVSLTDLQAHVKSRDLTWNIEIILRTFRQTVSAGTRSLLEVKKVDTVPYYRINPLFTDHAHKIHWEKIPDYEKLALDPEDE